MLFIWTGISIYPQASFPYTVTDPDGFTNIRAKPNAKSGIIGKLYKNEILHIYDTGDYYSHKEFEDKNPIWLPIDENNPDGAGYVYKKNIRCIYDLPKIKIKKPDDYILSFEKNGLQVEIEFEPFDTLNYQITEPADIGYITKINGYQALPALFSSSYIYESNDFIMIKKLSVSYNGKKSFVPKKDFIAFFIYRNTLFPHPDDPDSFWGIDVYGENNDAYIIIRIGDGGEHYVVTWIIRDGIYRGVDVW